VRCDGTLYRELSAPLLLGPGRHVCEAEKAGYSPQTITLNLEEGEPRTASIRLERTPKPRVVAPNQGAPGSRRQPTGGSPQPGATGTPKPKSEAKSEAKPKKPCGTFINPCR
jgi:hypothetical protein